MNAIIFREIEAFTLGKTPCFGVRIGLSPMPTDREVVVVAILTIKHVSRFSRNAYTNPQNGSKFKVIRQVFSPEAFQTDDQLKSWEATLRYAESQLGVPHNLQAEERNLVLA